MSSARKDARWQTATDMLHGLDNRPLGDLEPMLMDELTYEATEHLLAASDQINLILGDAFTEAQAKRWAMET